MSKIKSINSTYSKSTLSKEWKKNAQYKANIAKKCMVLIKKKSLTQIFIFWPSSHLWLKIMIQEFHMEAILSRRLTWGLRQRFQGEKRLIILCTFAFCWFFVLLQTIKNICQVFKCNKKYQINKTYLQKIMYKNSP